MFSKRAGWFYRGTKPRGEAPDKTWPVCLLNDFNNIPGKACLNGVDNNDAFENAENQHTKKTLRMKLLSYKKIKSHTCLEIFQSSNDTNRRGHSVLFESFSEA